MYTSTFRGAINCVPNTTNPILFSFSLSNLRFQALLFFLVCASDSVLPPNWVRQLFLDGCSLIQITRQPLVQNNSKQDGRAHWPGKPPHLNRWISTSHPQPKLCLLVQLYIFSLLYYYEYYFMLAALQFTFYLDFMCEVVSTMPCFKPF